MAIMDVLREVFHDISLFYGEYILSIFLWAMDFVRESEATPQSLSEKEWNRKMADKKS